MKVVIDITEQDYRLACNYPDALTSVYAHAIKKGILLPKGHGRLIDGDYLYKKFVANKCPDSLVLQFINDEPTVIEADEGETE